MIRSISAAAVGGATLVLTLPLPSMPVAVMVPWATLRILLSLLLLSLPMLHLHGCRGRDRARRVVPGLTLLAAALLGAALATAETGRRSPTRWPAALAGQLLVVTGRVATPPIALANSAHAARAIRFDIAVEHLACVPDLPDCRLPERWPRRIRAVDWQSNATADPDRTPGAGERRRFTLKLDPPDGRLNRGGFDQERWLFLERIDARATVRHMDAQVLAPARLGATGAIGRLRQSLATRLRALPGADEHLVLVQALTLGLRGSLAPVWRERLQASGTAHLIAISGLHVGLVFGFVLTLCAAAARLCRLACAGRMNEERLEAALEASLLHDRRSRWLARGRSLCRPAVLALLVAAGYAAMAGFAMPVQRALAMLCVMVIVRARQRVVAPGTTLALAALLVLLLDPVAPLAAGFWLSVGAVAALIWLQAGRQALWTGWSAQLKTVATLQLRLALLLLPLTVWSFQQASLVSPLTNLFAIPWVGLVTVPASLLATLLAPFEFPAPLASMLLHLAQASLRTLADGLDLALRLPHASLAIALPDATAALLALCALLACCVPLAGRSRGGLLALAPFLLLPALLHGGAARRVHGMELHVLDVGHGLAAIMLTERSTVLIDTGGGSAGATRLERDVLPYLRTIGRARVDLLVLTHLDDDHAAGLAPLAAAMPGLRILSSDVAGTVQRLESLAEGAPPSVGACRAGDGFQLDGVHFDFLHPAAHDPGSDNDRSCVLLVSDGHARVLLTGDIEAGAEARLVRRVGRLPVDVLVAPHHGSDSSSTDAFVATFPARHVVFATDRRSRWGFPHAVVRMRYKQTSARMYVTGITGSLAFAFASGPRAAADSGPGSGGVPPGVSALRDAARRVWRPLASVDADVVAATVPRRF